MTIVSGASYIKVAKPKVKKEVEKVDSSNEDVRKMKGGSTIVKFTMKSRRNMMYTVARIRRDCLPSFVTLTYPKEFPNSASVWKNDLERFVKRLRKKFSDISGIWKLEPQRRGAPHYHLLLWNHSTKALQEFVPFAWNEVVAPDNIEHLRWHLGRIDNIPCVQEVHTQKQMYLYVMKYISKATSEEWNKVGRWWGVLGRQFLPFGDEVIFEVTEKNANDIIRYMRRYTRFGKGLALQSRQQVCDADQWMEKLQTIPMLTFRDWLQLPQVKEVGQNVSV